jgi:hypothetical protein
MPATKEPLLTKASQPEEVDTFMTKLRHPLKDVTESLRRIILAADKSIGEGISWNAPSFFYTGKMKPFKPKEYKRFIIVFNFFKKDCIRLIFLRGAMANDKTGLLQGDYADGRRLAFFHDMKEVKSGEKALQSTIKKLVKIIDKK